jgi:hypothetical protein
VRLTDVNTRGMRVGGSRMRLTDANTTRLA